MGSSSDPAAPSPQFLFALSTIFLLAAPAVSAEDGSKDIVVTWRDGEGETISKDDVVGVHRPEVRNETARESSARFRIEVRASVGPPSVRLSVVSRPAPNRGSRGRIDNLELEPLPDGRLVSPWLVAVPDPDDLFAEGLEGRAILVKLGDLVEARVRRGGERALVSSRSVGSSVLTGGSRDNLILPVRVMIVSLDGEDGPVVGGDEAGAIALARHQLEVVDQVLARCHIALPEARDVEISVEPCAGLSVLVVGARNGLLSTGGIVRLRVDDREVGPWKVGEGYTPEETARLLAGHLEAEGYRVELFTPPRAPSRAHGSADLVVRRADGSSAEMMISLEAPLTTEKSQSLEIGRLDLVDGLDSYDANTRASGTVEERVLLRATGRSKENRKVVKIFFINRFADVSRQGESIAEADVGGMGSVIVDSRALLRARQAYTLAHELGHLLLGDPGHPHDEEAGGTWKLMHSSASSAVDGPRWIAGDECEKMRRFKGLVRSSAKAP